MAFIETYRQSLLTVTDTIASPGYLQVVPVDAVETKQGEIISAGHSIRELLVDQTYDLPTSPLWEGLEGKLKDQLVHYLISKELVGKLQFRGPVSWMLESFVTPTFNGKPEEEIFVEQIHTWPGEYIGHEVFSAGFVVRVWNDPSTADSSLGVVLSLPSDSGFSPLRIQRLYRMRTGDSPIPYRPDANVTEDTFDPIEHWGFTPDFHSMTDAQVFSEAVEAGIVSVPNGSGSNLEAAFVEAQGNTYFAFLRRELCSARDYIVSPTLCVGEMEGLWQWLLRPRTTENPEEPLLSEMLAQQIVAPNAVYLRDSIVKVPLKQGTLIPIWIENENGIEARDYVLQLWVRFSIFAG